MTGARGGLLAAYEATAELVKIQSGIIDRLFAALSQVADVDDEEIVAIRKAAQMREAAEDNGYI